jgi:two-component system sensor histidine kinase HydH
MERSLQTLLDFARPQPAERRAVSVRAVVEQVRGLVQGRASRQRVELDLRVPERDVTVIADAQQIEQVLINLALNALDAMPSGGRLTIAVSESPGALTLTVTDTGPGISAAMLPRLFEPFVSGKPTGVGLGLVISRRIVEDHGGTLTAANRPEGGAAFIVTLPRSP